MAAMVNGAVMNGPAVGMKPSAALHRLGDNVFEAPAFTKPLEEGLTVPEGEPARLTTQVGPSGDPSLSVEWFKDGKPLTAGSRFVTVFDRGYCVLDFLYTIAEDTGTYACVASSNFGSSQTQPTQITVIPEDAIDYQSAQLIQAQTATFSENAPLPEQKSAAPPQFTKQLTGGGELNQFDPCRIEGQIEPHNDTSMNVYWFKDGKPVSTGSRINIIHDRGFCLLEFGYCFPEDSGVYVCLAQNSLGDAQSNPVEILCHPDEAIVTKSNLAESSMNQLKQLEINEQDIGAAEYRFQEDDQAPTAPQFAVPLKPTQAIESGPAKFLVKVDGVPSPTVTWFINNLQVVSDSIIKTYNDGSINYLEISRCSEVGEFHIKAVAENAQGQSESEVVLTVHPSDFNVPDLKHITPDPYTNPYKKMTALKKVECSPELVNALKKPKPTAENIVNLERGVEIKGQHTKTADVVETEKMYGQIQANLRKKNPHASMGHGVSGGGHHARRGTQEIETAFDIQLDD